MNPLNHLTKETQDRLDMAADHLTVAYGSLVNEGVPDPLVEDISYVLECIENTLRHYEPV